MSVQVSFNLDELTASKFQELCSVLLQNKFSELVTPMVRSGKDGQLDGKLEKLPINYSDLLLAPLEYLAPDGSDTFWVFQCKHTQVQQENRRQRWIVSAIKTEVESWKEKTRKPTHFILLTNVNLQKSTLDEIEQVGKAFPYFEVWHEPKISNFVADSVALQKTFYPNRATSLDLIRVTDLKTLTEVIPDSDAQLSLALPEQSSRHSGRLLARGCNPKNMAEPSCDTLSPKYFCTSFCHV